MDPAPPPMDYIAGSGGIFRDCAVHDFDVLRWITGQQAVEVYATGSVQGDPLFTEYGDVDTAAVVVTFDGGTLGLVSAARYNGAATTAGSRSTVSTTPWSPAGTRARRSETSIPRNEFPEGRPPLLHGPLHRGVPRRARPRSSTWSTATPRPRAPSPTPSRSPGWPKPPPSRAARRAGTHRGGEVTMKIAGAPISWGVCEVPGWGYQLDPDRVLAEMRDVGLSATELGPEGFLPSDPAELTALLDSYGSLRRRVRPGGAARCRPRSVADIAAPLDALVACGAKVLVLAAATGADGYDSGPTSTTANGAHCWPTWTGWPRRRRARRARGAAPARRHDGGDPRRRRPGAGRVGHPALPGHRPPADRRHRSAAAGPRGARTGSRTPT